jgi:NAD(P)-dependent dehydrogenase (short-subunit alcohol dehydrogenase family)
MSADSRSVVIVTGAGSGIGRAIAQSLATSGHTVYSGMRDLEGRSAARVTAARAFAAEHGVTLLPLELDVTSEVSARSAVDQVLAEQGRLDVVVNNAGMLMVGPGEAFTPEQFQRILDLNAVSWLRVNRAALPTMRRQGSGTLVYVGSTTAHVIEPFMATYIASKAAGEAFAESLGFEVTGFGIETVIVVPGAFTQGTEHFAHSESPATTTVMGQYADIAARTATMPARLEAIDRAQDGGPADVDSIGTAVAEVLALPRGTRPRRVVVDAQRKGVDEIAAAADARQEAFFRQLGIDDLIRVPAAQQKERNESHA